MSGDWSSDVCSSDLLLVETLTPPGHPMLSRLCWWSTHTRATCAFYGVRCSGHMIQCKASARPWRSSVTQARTCGLAWCLLASQQPMPDNPGTPSLPFREGRRYCIRAPIEACKYSFRSSRKDVVSPDLQFSGSPIFCTPRLLFTTKLMSDLRSHPRNFQDQRRPSRPPKLTRDFESSRKLAGTSFCSESPRLPI